MKQFLLLFTLLAPLTAFAQKVFDNIQQSQLQQNQFLLSWSSSISGTTAVQYGLSTELELGIIKNATKSTHHQILVSNLQAATFYYARPLVINNTDTLFGPIGYYSTQSNSTGVMRISFNQDVDPLYSTGTAPYIVSGGQNIENEIISMINQATSTIDIAVYNTTRDDIVTALVAAHNSGVRVRFIANSGTITSNASLTPQPPFPVFYVNPTELMHNKFMIIDADSVNKSWVWTGSGNWTYTDMYTNYNNYIAIQDQALALAYRIEFEEMWGSSTASYNTNTSKVGALKTNNTPHTFNIAGKTVESYFSPSDGTTDQIEAAINSANYDLEFCVLSYTRNELGTVVRNKHSAGVFEHGIMENINDPGSEFSWLISQGVNILADNHATDLHHKYAVIDAGNSASDPLVVTGSHNWTTAAEEANDENTLIIHDATAANLFLQEFTLRWCEVKNNTNCTLPFTTTSLTTIEAQKQAKLYPNPTSNLSTLQLSTVLQQNATAVLYNNLGQVIRSFELQAGQLEHQLDFNSIGNGLYFLSIQNNQQVERLSVLIVR